MTASTAAAPPDTAPAGRATAAISRHRCRRRIPRADQLDHDRGRAAVARRSVSDRRRRRRVARHRVPARDGERSAARRTARRLVRPPQALRRRLRRSPRGISRLRPGAVIRRASRLSIASGAGDGCDGPKRRRHPPARRSRRPPWGRVRVVRRLHDSGGRHRACRRRGPHRPVRLRLDLLDQPPDTRGRRAACAATASRNTDCFGDTARRHRSRASHLDAGRGRLGVRLRTKCRRCGHQRRWPGPPSCWPSRSCAGNGGIPYRSSTFGSSAIRPSRPPAPPYCCPI